MNFNVLEQISTPTDLFRKITVEKSELLEILNSLKNNAQFDFDRLNTIIAVDLGLEIGKFELIYDLHSTNTGLSGRISVLLDRNAPQVDSITEIYKSAYFDECEIFDLFGINFDKNPDLKRLLIPKGWVGYPLRKDYKQEDERLKWNEK